jgi:hypothetical protein
MTASFRATATLALRSPLRFASRMPQALSACAEATALPLTLTDSQFAAVFARDIVRVSRRYPEIHDPAVRALIADRLMVLTGRQLDRVSR